jgi:hypothetical protein
VSSRQILQILAFQPYDGFPTPPLFPLDQIAAMKEEEEDDNEEEEDDNEEEEDDNEEEEDDNEEEEEVPEALSIPLADSPFSFVPRSEVAP